ncbi:MAG: hypothetical protein ACE5OY_01135 [Candidatus Bathyarchaeia archaeon]
MTLIEIIQAIGNTRWATALQPILQPLPLSTLDVSVIIGLIAIAFFIVIVFSATKPRRMETGEEELPVREVAVEEVLARPLEHTVKLEEAKEAKGKLEALKMERGFLADFITKIYEARDKGILAGDEAEGMVERYRERMHKLDEEAARNEAVAELYDLEETRGKLVKDFAERYLSMDKRMADLREKLMIVKAPPPKPPTTPPPTPTTEGEEREETRKEKTKADEEVRRLMGEIEKELKKLERMEVEEE